MDRVGGPVDWGEYRAAQQARREVRRKERLGGLVAVLPPGFSVEPIRGAPDSPTMVRIWGYGVEAWFDPTHNTLWYMGEKRDEVEVFRVVRLLEGEAIVEVIRRLWSLVLVGSF